MRFDWNAYPETKEVVDASGLTSVAETEELRAMYNGACKIYRRDGGQDEWRRRFTIMVFKTYVDLGRSKSSYRRRSPSIKLSHGESWEPKRSHRLESQPPLPYLAPPSPQFISFSPTNKLISNLSSVASPACKTNSLNPSWDPWRKLVAPLKLWYRRKIITNILAGYEQLSQRLVPLSGP